MTDKQQRFVDAKLEGKSNSQAARDAEYKGSEGTIGTVGWENMQKPAIKEALAGKRAEIAEKVDWTVEVAQLKLKTAYDLALTCKQPSAMVSAIVATNRMFGLDMDARADTEQQELSASEERLGREVAKLWADGVLKGPQLAQDELEAKKGA